MSDEEDYTGETDYDLRAIPAPAGVGDIGAKDLLGYRFAGQPAAPALRQRIMDAHGVDIDAPKN